MKSEINSFSIDSQETIDEIQVKLTEITHEPTGAKIIHLASDDQENVFNLCFQTLPESSNGVAHILEHCVLCGSEKFQARDPFFSMHRRSLATFMNAMTGSDFTCYPASSMIEKDFYHLLDVYLDAVFFPKLTELSFSQEGHRFNFEKDSLEELVYDGVVYNEMKGAMSSPDARLWEALCKELFPDTIYAHNSGGSPLEIPKLSYEEFKKFHQTFYHPSHCLFLFYGNIPLEHHLKFLEENLFSKVKTPPPPKPSLTLQPLFKAPKHAFAPFPVAKGNHEEGYIHSISYLTAEINNQEDILALTVIDSLLTEHDASPLKRALLSSGLCKQVDAMLDTEMAQAPYVIVCKGCKKDAGEKIIGIIEETLTDCIRKGFSKKQIEAALQVIEYQKLEINNDYGPHGLGLLMRAAGHKLLNRPPAEALKFHELFDQIHKNFEDPTYIQRILSHYFLENSHRVLLTMKPDEELLNREWTEEKKILKNLEGKLTDQQKAEIFRLNQELEKQQNQDESKAVESLPELKIGDVPKQTIDYPLSFSVTNGLKTFHHNCFTNQMISVELCYPIPELKAEEMPWVQLLCSYLGDLGCGDKNFEEVLFATQRYSGGIHAYFSMFQQMHSTHQAKPACILRGKALKRNLPPFSQLLIDVAQTTNFKDKPRLKELIKQSYSFLKNRLNKASMNYSIQGAYSGLDPVANLRQLATGLPYFRFIRSLYQTLDDSLEQVQAKLTSLYQKIFIQHGPEMVLSCSNDTFDEWMQLPNLSLLKHSSAPYVWEPKEISALSSPHAFYTSSSVAFNSLAFKTISEPDKNASHILLASELMDNLILHREIREKGGAYGGGSHYQSLSGLMHYYSYRDPNIQNTLESFQKAADMLRDKGISDQDLHEAKLSALQHFDSPISPLSRATVSYGYSRTGRDLESRQTFRNQLLKANKSDILAALEQIKNDQKHNCSRVFASRHLCEEEKVAFTAESI